MKIHFIGARGYPASYASAEDLVRELAPRLQRDGHEVTVHGWETEESRAANLRADTYNGIRRVFHANPGGKVSGQLTVAVKASIAASFSDCDLVHYQYINSGIFSFIPRLFGKKIVVNVNGQMWKDPKWPWGIRHLFFNIGAVWCLLIAHVVLTDSYHMSRIYRRRFFVNVPHIGYGCNTESGDSTAGVSKIGFPKNYYLIMSRITPHNLTDLLIEGFIKSGSSAELVIAGHTPDNRWFHRLQKRAQGYRISFLGLVKDQTYLDCLIKNCRAYLHGHSLGGINPALVRVVGKDKPVIAVDTLFNREVLQPQGKQVYGTLFERSAKSIANAIKSFEACEELKNKDACLLGAIIRESMSWDRIYAQYLDIYNGVLVHPS